MTQRTRRRATHLIVSLGMAGILLGLGGCSAGATAGSAPAGTSVSDSGVPESATRVPAEGKPSAAGDRQIARSASIALTVSNAVATAADLGRIAARFGGSITTESLALDTAERQTSFVVVSVPAARLDEALGAVAELGEVTSRVIDSSDVTDAVVDVDARVKTLRESIERLQALMKRAGSVADIAAVESELTSRQATLESLLAQQKALKGLVENSLITVSLTVRDTARPGTQSGFLPGLAAGWEALLAAGRVLLTLLGAALPFLGVAVIVGTPLLVWRRRRRAAKVAAQETPSETTE